MKKNIVHSAFIFLLAAGISGLSSAAYANNEPPPYDALNLSAQQSQEINRIEADWKTKYQNLQPQLLTEQRRLTQMLSASHVDPLDITSTQQHINQIKEQLSSSATATYLKKRRLLNNEQQQGLEGWMKRMISQKQKS